MHFNFDTSLQYFALCTAAELPTDIAVCYHYPVYHLLGPRGTRVASASEVRASKFSIACHLLFTPVPWHISVVDALVVVTSCARLTVASASSCEVIRARPHQIGRVAELALLRTTLRNKNVWLANVAGRKPMLASA